MKSVDLTPQTHVFCSALPRRGTHALLAAQEAGGIPLHARTLAPLTLTGSQTVVREYAHS